MKATALADPSTATPPPHGRPAAPKWAAVVDDTLVPLPRRRLHARDILAQAGTEGGAVLVRDLNQPADIPLDPDAEVDLAAGNVFRSVQACDVRPAAHPPTGPAKLAFVADDAWEVTTNPQQSLDSLRGLFGLPADAVVLRDYESPDDEPIAAGTTVRFEDGPVFRTRVSGVTVKVNNQPVRFTVRRATGLEIKQTAIRQGVAIEVGFVLYRTKADGGLGPAIGDEAKVTLKECDEFTCVAPDDNS